MSNKHWLVCRGNWEGCFLRRKSPTHWPHKEEQQGGRAKPAVSLFPSPSSLLPPSSFQDRNPEGILLWWDSQCPQLFHLAHNTVGQILSNDGFCTFSFCLFICVRSLTHPGFYFFHKIYLWFNYFQSSSGKLFSSDLQILSLRFTYSVLKCHFGFILETL